MSLRFWKGVLLIDGLIPAGMLGFWAATDRMGANPVDFFTRTTGTLGMIFLLLSLAVTPLRKVSGWGQIGKLRRIMGLLAFFYVFLHFTAWVWFDQSFSLSGMVGDVFQRPFIALGFAAFAFMVPMAVTSTNGWIKRLGGKRWQKIHRRVYLVGVLAVLHFAFLVKADLRLPVMYGGFLVLLLGYRIVTALLTRDARLRSDRV
jgi:methionine sulfoxide reductase heme-binding subunit